MKKIICLLSMVLALSCTTQKSDVPVFNLADAGKVDVNPDFVLNDIVESATYLQLEGNDSVFHRNPNIYSINDNGDYCLVDQMNNSIISIYNKEGKLLSNFSRYGRGNGEYLYISSLIFDGDDKIEVLEEDAGIIYQYNKKGEYKSKKTAEGAFLISALDGGKYLSLMAIYKTKDINNFVSILDSEGNVSERFFEVDSAKLDGTTTRPMSMIRCENGYNFPLSTFNGGDVYYNYDMKENKFSEICRFDVGQYKITKDVLTGGGNPSDYIIMIEPYKVENYLFVQFYNHGDFDTDVWDLSTGKMIARRSTLAASKGNLVYNLPLGDSVSLNFKGFNVHNDQFIFLCAPAKLSGKISQDIDPEGNTVIVTLKLKQ